MANSRAKAIDQPEGFVKILIADYKTDKVLGVEFYHIIGPHAGEMIAEMSVAMEFGVPYEKILQELAMLIQLFQFQKFWRL